MRRTLIEIKTEYLISIVISFFRPQYSLRNTEIGDRLFTIMQKFYTAE
jgi:hypothetical protein